ncbi:MAG TPA: ATP-binding protein [bacterium]
MSRLSDNSWKIQIGILIIFVATLHYSTPTSLHHLHELYRVFYYVPIILAAFRFQFRGGIISAIAVILIYFPHVVFQWGGDFLFNFSRFLEMAMYLIIGGVAGRLAERESNERKKFQHATWELERSFEKLKYQSEKIAELDEQLRNSERLSILGELAASLAHEVRNPLGSIWGVVEILKDECEKHGKNSDFLKILIDEVKRLNQVVENYLSLAKQRHLELSQCNLRDIVQSVIYLLSYKARKQGIILQTDFPEKDLFVHANESQLQQILINLVLNSMAAITDDGTVTVKAGLHLLENPFTDSEESTSLYLSVIDTGQGIQPDEMEKIFKPFYTTREDGTGLGLSIVKRIVDQNKWKIEVDSTPGRGTTIAIIFPLEEMDVK